MQLFVKNFQNLSVYNQPPFRLHLSNDEAMKKALFGVEAIEAEKASLLTLVF